VSNKPFKYVFEVGNPSRYPRSDYVEVDLNTLSVPNALASQGDQALTLRRFEGGMPGEEVPFQVDTVFGDDFPSRPKRVLTFFCGDTPPGEENYSLTSATFLLEEAPRKTTSPPEDLWIKYYHSPRVAGEPEDGCSDRWDPNRRVNGVKLSNGAIEVYMRVVPRIFDTEPFNLAGAVTSVLHRRVRDHTCEENSLSPHIYAPRKDLAHWAQITRLVFYPLPWERRWFHTVHLLGPDRPYHLVYARRGTVRAAITLKSDPFPVRFNGQPFFKDQIEVACRLYRVISVYRRAHSWGDPHAEFYFEQLHVLSDCGLSLAFRAYFSSFLPFSDGAFRHFARLEHLPNCFALWRESYGMSWGYGFAADSHCRQVETKGDEITWRLQLNHIHNCNHQFMFHQQFEHDQFRAPESGLHEVGHFAWYERIFKPLEVIPLSKYLLRDPEDEPPATEKIPITA